MRLLYYFFLLVGSSCAQVKLIWPFVPNSLFNAIFCIVHLFTISILVIIAAYYTCNGVLTGAGQEEEKDQPENVVEDTGAKEAIPKSESII